MKALEELKNTVSIKIEDWIGDISKGQGIVFIIANINEITSYMFYQLLFRLEGTTVGGRGAEINIIDTGDVIGKRDMAVGMFTEEDEGKNKTDALVERYEKVFTTKIFKIEEEKAFEKEMSRDGRGIVIIGFGKEVRESDRWIKRIYKDQAKRLGKGSVVRVHGYSHESKVKVHTSVYGLDGILYGERELKREESEKKTAEQATIEGQMVAGTMMMVLNTLITEDKEIEGNKYSLVEMSIETGEQVSEKYKKRTDIISTRGKLWVLYRYDVGVGNIDAYSNEFRELVKEVRKTKFEKENKVRRIVERYKEMWEDLFKDRIKELGKGKMFVYEKRLHEEIGMLLALMEVAKDVYEDYAVVSMVDKRFSVVHFIK